MKNSFSIIPQWKNSILRFSKTRYFLGNKSWNLCVKKFLTRSLCFLFLIGMLYAPRICREYEPVLFYFFLISRGISIFQGENVLFNFSRGCLFVLNYHLPLFKSSDKSLLIIFGSLCDNEYIRSSLPFTVTAQTFIGFRSTKDRETILNGFQSSSSLFCPFSLFLSILFSLSLSLSTLSLRTHFVTFKRTVSSSDSPDASFSSQPWLSPFASALRYFCNFVSRYSIECESLSVRISQEENPT